MFHEYVIQLMSTPISWRLPREDKYGYKNYSNWRFEDTFVPKHDGDGILMFILIKTVIYVGVINGEIWYNITRNGQLQNEI